MIKLLPYELEKIWRRKSFPALMLLLLILNVFLLWYLNKPNENQPPLSAYKAISADLAARSPEEQTEYLARLRETMDGLEIVEQIIILQSYGNEFSSVHAEALLKNNHEIFEKYKSAYLDGSCLIYTDSLAKENALINEIADEYKIVSSYDEYIASIEENKNRLNGISIFVKDDVDSFSSRNIEKSYADHKNLNSANIRFAPSKGVQMASENTITDLFILLSIMLFVGGLITEEKEKGLFHVTRATRFGIAKCISAKLAALFIQCLVIVLLLYGSNFIYASVTTGICDPFASIHSVAVFQESSLEITLFAYFALIYLTKVVVIFTFGAAVAAVSIISPRSLIPQLAAVGGLALNWLAFAFIPAYSMFNPIKYLSFWGMINPKFLYGEYLNFNIVEYPVSRTLAAVVVITVLFAAVIALSFFLFAKGGGLDVRRTRRASLIPFKLHSSLLVHEGSKILFTSKAVAVLLIFGFLIGYGDLNRSNYLSVGEQYYQNIMTELEGELTDEKEHYILGEKARYDEAFAQITAIDEMVSSGAVDRIAGEQMKSRWYAITALYPYFQRAETQYEHILENGGVFIYDTGYRYLFGKVDDDFLIDLLLISMCMVFALGNVLPMEEQTKSWCLLSATAKGKRRIISSKLIVCASCAVIMTILPFVFRMIATLKTYPLAMWSSATHDLPMYYESGLLLPIWAFTAAAVILQIISILIITAIVILISANRKSFLQTVFLGLLILVVPLTLSEMGLEPAKWFSVYPLYSLTKLI